MSSFNNVLFDKFSRHTPRILKHQLIAQLVNHFLLSRTDVSKVENAEKFALQPSIERFHCALLFVDISGFTVLSQRLNVDDLRIHINAYFKKILDIVESFDGEVIKFAGDALFIIWQTQISSLESPHFKTEALKAVRQAVACGMRINAECSNHKISFDSKKSSDLHTLFQSADYKSFVSNSDIFTTAGQSFKDSDKDEKDDSVAYLNVHSGLSMGLMAGIDVGAFDRWEYLILGEPLADVAAAESVAGQGELVISKVAHDLLHEQFRGSEDVKVSPEKALTSASSFFGIQASCKFNPSFKRSPSSRGSSSGGKAKSVHSASINNGMSQATTAGLETALPQSEERTDAITTSVLPCGCRVTENALFLIAPSTNSQKIRSVWSRDSVEEDLGGILRFGRSTESSFVSAKVGSSHHGFSSLNYSQRQLYTQSLSTKSNLVSASLDLSSAYQTPREQEETRIQEQYNRKQHLISKQEVADMYPVVRSSLEKKIGLQIRNIIKSDKRVQEALAAKQFLSPAWGESERSNTNMYTAIENSRKDMKITDKAKSLRPNKPTARNVDGIVTTPESHDVSFSMKGPEVDTKSSSAQLPNMSFTSTAASDKSMSMDELAPHILVHGGDYVDEDDEDQYEFDSILTALYAHWTDTCLFDDIMKHVHRVAMLTDCHNHEYVQDRSFVRLATDYLHSLASPFQSSAAPTRLSRKENSLKLKIDMKEEMEAQLTSDKSEISSPRPSHTPSSGSGHVRTHSQRANAVRENVAREAMTDSSNLTAELRNVIVMFIRVDMTGLSLIHEAHVEGVDRIAGSLADSAFKFLPRSINELIADQNILDRFQSCISIIIKAFHEKGGHLRQFIVDDKGTVCIGTFGLRGSVNYDNAAAAIDSAHSILLRMQEENMNAAIGVTSGKTYCGLVGSPYRHEYAVMGPSTNLSARLMCKANPGEIICDAATRRSDRSHTFITMSKIKAKGYENPVTIYKPVLHFERASSHSSNIPRSPMAMSIKQRMPSFTKMMRIASAESSKVDMFPYPTITMAIDSARSVDDADETSSYGGGIQPVAGMSSSHFGSIDDALMMNESFFINSKKLLLHGRGDDMVKAMNFLLPMADSPAEEVAGAEEFKKLMRTSMYNNCTSESSSKLLTMRALQPEATHQLFETDLSCMVAMVVGPLGIGKTAFIHAVCDKLKFFSEKQMQKHQEYNINLFHSQPAMGGGRVSQPLFAWKSLIAEILHVCCEKLGRPGRSSVSDNVPFSSSAGPQVNQKTGACSQATVSPSSFTSSDRDGLAVTPRLRKSTYRTLNATTLSIRETPGSEKSLLVLFNLLPLTLQPYVPLLNDLKLTSNLPENETTKALDNVARLEKLTILLAALINLCSEITKQLTFIVIDDLQVFDSTSWTLLSLVWSSCTGVVVLAGYRPLTHKGPGASAHNSHLFHHASNPSSAHSSKPSSPRSQSPLPQAPPAVGTKPLPSTGGVKEKGMHSLRARASMQYSEQIRKDHNLLQHQQLEQQRHHQQQQQQKGHSPVVHDVLNSFIGSSRFLVLELKEVDLSAITHLAEDIFKTHHLNDLDPSVYQRIFEMSGGNPLYACELTQAITKQVLALPNRSSALLAEVMKDFRTTRIEEVICHRFDQLDTACQLTLKLASVVCSNGAFFTIPMLAQIMSDSSSKMKNIFDVIVNNSGYNANELGDVDGEEIQRAVEINLSIVLSKILERNEFIKSFENKVQALQRARSMASLKGGGEPGLHSSLSGIFDGFATISDSDYDEDDCDYLEIASDVSGGSFNVEALLKLAFEFRIVFEQLTIYELMLDDQKQLLHGRVAAYLASKNEIKDNLDASDLYEEGYHWESAKNYSSALGCYYRSAMLLSNKGAQQDSRFHMVAAYRMLNNLRMTAGVSSEESLAACSALLELLSPSAVGHAVGAGDIMVNSGVNQYDISSNHTPIGVASNSQNLPNSPRAGGSLGSPLPTSSPSPSLVRSHFDHNTTFNESMMNLDSKFKNSKQTGNRKSMRNRPLTNMDLYNIFNQGDVELLETAVKLLFHLGISHLKLGGDVSSAAVFYEEACLYLSLSLKSDGYSQSIKGWTRSFLLKSSKDSFIVASSSKDSLQLSSSDKVDGLQERLGINLSLDISSYPLQSVDELGSDDTSGEINNEGFSFMDASFCFPYLAGLISMYRSKMLPDDASHTKQMQACELFVNMARKQLAFHLTTTSSKAAVTPQSSMCHVLVGLYFKRSVLFELGRVTRAGAIADTVRELYDFELHHSEINKFYGWDRIPQMLALHVQVLIMIGNLHEARMLSEQLMILAMKLKRTKHAACERALSLFMFPLCGAMICMGCFKQATQLWQICTKEAQTPRAKAPPPAASSGTAHIGAPLESPHSIAASKRQQYHQQQQQQSQQQQQNEHESDLFNISSGAQVAADGVKRPPAINTALLSSPGPRTSTGTAFQKTASMEQKQHDVSFLRSRSKNGESSATYSEFRPLFENLLHRLYTSFPAPSDKSGAATSCLTPAPSSFLMVDVHTPDISDTPTGSAALSSGGKKALPSHDTVRQGRKGSSTTSPPAAQTCYSTVTAASAGEGAAAAPLEREEDSASLNKSPFNPVSWFGNNRKSNSRQDSMNGSRVGTPKPDRCAETSTSTTSRSSSPGPAGTPTQHSSPNSTGATDQSKILEKRPGDVDVDVDVVVEPLTLLARLRNEATEADMMQRSLLYDSVDNRPRNYAALDFLGVNIEFICAYICFLKCETTTPYSPRENKSPKSLLRSKLQTLNIALDYINFSLECSHTKSECIFSIFTGSILKAKILNKMAELETENAENENNQQLAVAYMDEVADVLISCGQMGQISDNFHFISISAGCLMLDLDIEKDKGLQFISAGVRGVRRAASYAVTPPSLLNRVQTSDSNDDQQSLLGAKEQFMRKHNVPPLDSTYYRLSLPYIEELLPAAKSTINVVNSEV